MATALKLSFTCCGAHAVISEHVPRAMAAAPDLLRTPGW
jgi:hypothetical protein